MASKIGVLHPGAMGVSVASTVVNSGYDVYWAGEGRSTATRSRASHVGLRDAGTVADLCATCHVIVSVCPPHAAVTVAEEVAASGFDGLYLDANAISPQRAGQIGAAMAAAGIDYVDGGIIGGPAWEAGKTWLYLSGPRASDAAALFSAGPLETEVLGDEVAAASALKICFAAYTKGTTALLAAILATAEELHVREALARQWSRGGSSFAGDTERRVRQVTAKAWRFVGEMEEISATFADAGQPGEFHAAAALIYRRLANFKDAETTPELQAVLDALKTSPESG